LFIKSFIFPCGELKFGKPSGTFSISIVSSDIYSPSLISCSCGYHAKGGAKGVGEATNKAVVWSFVAIVIWDMIFAIAFFF